MEKKTGKSKYRLGTYSPKMNEKWIIDLHVKMQKYKTSRKKKKKQENLDDLV